MPTSGRGPQLCCTNHKAKSAVIRQCGSSVPTPCSQSMLYGSSVSPPPPCPLPTSFVIKSVQLVSNNPNNIYDYPVSNNTYASYIYLVTLQSNQSKCIYSYWHDIPIILENTSNNDTGTFNSNFNIQSASGNTKPPFCYLILNASNLTTSQSSSSYYTINAGTYSISINGTTSTQTVTFGSVTFSGSTPSQSITINN